MNQLDHSIVITDLLMTTLENCAKELAIRCIKECARRHGFDASEEIIILGLTTKEQPKEPPKKTLKRKERTTKLEAKKEQHTTENNQLECKTQAEIDMEHETKHQMEADHKKTERVAKLAAKRKQEKDEKDAKKEAEKAAKEAKRKQEKDEKDAKKAAKEAEKEQRTKEKKVKSTKKQKDVIIESSTNEIITESSEDIKEYLVRINLTWSNELNTKDKKINFIANTFGEPFVLDADANLDGKYIEIFEDCATFKLAQQEIDDPNGSFTRENINKCLQYVQTQSPIPFTYSINTY